MILITLKRSCQLFCIRQSSKKKETTALYVSWKFQVKLGKLLADIPTTKIALMFGPARTSPVQPAALPWQRKTLLVLSRIPKDSFEEISHFL